MTDLTQAPQVPFHGIWPALLTPLDADLAINQPRFNHHALRLLAAGCTGVTPFGTTGEGPAFSLAEREAAINGLVAGGVPAHRILVSTSCVALPETLQLTRHALAIGAHGCLMLPPFFLKGVSDQGIVDAYRYVLDRTATGAASGGVDARLKLYLYHIPQVAAVGLSHAVIAELKARYPGTIVGIKDSQCQRDHSVALAAAFMQDVRVYVGNEPDLPELAALGSTGAVSGLANMLPRTVAALVAEHASAQTPARLARIRGLLELLGGYALVPALKGIMALIDGDAGWLRVRPTLVALDDGAFEALLAQLQQIGLTDLTG